MRSGDYLREFSSWNTERQVFLGCFFVGLTAVSGSLYFSEVMMLIPCELCWYQRILTYPVPLIILSSVVRDEYGSMYSTVIPLTGLNMIVALNHILIQQGVSNTCTLGCGGIQFELFGIVTIPMMSFTASAIIFGCTVVLFVRRIKY